MSKPSAETLEILGWIRTEIGAGMVLIPKSEVEIVWNNAHERANSIIGSYAEGMGLFQMTRQSTGRSIRAPAKGASPKTREEGADGETP